MTVLSYLFQTNETLAELDEAAATTKAFTDRETSLDSATKSPEKLRQAAVAGTIIAVLGRSSTPVKDDRRCSPPDAAEDYFAMQSDGFRQSPPSSSSVDADRLSTVQLSTKFTENVQHGIAQSPLGSSRFDTTRLDTFDVSSPCILAASSLSNSTARHTRHDELDTLVSTRSTRRTCRVVLRRDVTSQVEFGFIRCAPVCICFIIIF